MKKIKINFRALLKSLPALIIVALYWYWINQKIISDSNEAFSLTGFFLLICAATAFFPLPANIIVLGAAKSSDPMLVAFVGGAATLVAYFAEYMVFTTLFKFNKIANFKNSWVYEKAAPLFEKHKFLILAVTSFLPIPAEALRIYAITRKYSKPLFMFSGFLGRIPRYYLLAYYGRDYVNSVWFLAAVFIFPGVLLLIIKWGASLGVLLKERLIKTPGELEDFGDSQA